MSVENRKPLALVYRGRAALPGCPESVAALLRASRWDFDVRYVGPNESLQLTPSVLDAAAIYAQPGGATLGKAWKRMRKHRKAMRAYVAGGGRYIGFCLGGYLAGATPGFALIPGDTDQYIGSEHATVRTTRDTLVDVDWRGTRTTLYFQDGPVFQLEPTAEDVEVLGTYPNGEIAALCASYGSGRVAVVGPHPEATHDWFADSGLPEPDSRGHAAGLDLIDAVMREADDASSLPTLTRLGYS